MPTEASIISALRAAVDDVRQSLAAREARITELTEELADAQVQVQGLKAEERVLVAAISRRGGQSPVSVAVDRDWSRMTRSDAVEAVLNDADTPLSIGEIVDRLSEVDRDDTYNSTSAALAYLKRTHRAGTVARGQWVSTPTSRA
jgi:hypothetical protein